MDVLSTAINAAVIVIVGGLSARHAKGRFDALERRMDRLEGRIDRLDGRVDSGRSDLTQLALALGVRPRASER